MQTPRRMYALVLLCFIVGTVPATADITGRTGSSTSGCPCHGGTASGTVTVAIAGPATLAPGATGNYTITVTKAGTSYAGVDISVTGGATLSTTDAALKVSSSEVTHRAALTPGTAYSFKVTAPASGASFVINAAGVASTINNNAGGNFNFSPATNVALPIQLAAFTGSATSGNGVQLSWKTLSEINNYGFYVQRGPSVSGPFADMPGAFVPGNGTTVEAHTYSYIDVAAPPATGTYYRLRQVNLDGSQSISDPIGVMGTTSVSVDVAPMTFRLSQNYPNPFNPTTMISFQVPVAGNVELKVFDVSGREVATLVSGMRPAGSYQEAFNGAGLSSGIYLCRLVAGGSVKVVKMVLSK
jgi:hypothetical protein